MTGVGRVLWKRQWLVHGELDYVIGGKASCVHTSLAYGQGSRLCAFGKRQSLHHMYVHAVRRVLSTHSTDL